VYCSQVGGREIGGNADTHQAESRSPSHCSDVARVDEVSLATDLAGRHPGTLEVATFDECVGGQQDVPFETARNRAIIPWADDTAATNRKRRQQAIQERELADLG
jgi:hypothetical protein